MSLSLLVNGAECGPSNPLQGLSKRYDQDRGIQQDHFGAGQAGPSRQTFRTQGTGRTVDADAARFFGSAPPPQDLAHHATPFDVSDLHRALPNTIPHTHAHAQNATPLHTRVESAVPASSWAMDFSMQGLATTSAAAAPAMSAVQSPVQAASPQVLSPGGNMQGPSQWYPRYMNQMNHFPSLQSSTPGPQVHSPSPMVDWEKEFQMQEASLVPDVIAETQEATSHKPPVETDELARTAGILIDHVKDEANPKFKQSQFLSLMRQLRDHEVVVEGNQMIDASLAEGGATSSTSLKGKGRADLSFGPSTVMGGGVENATTEALRATNEGESANDAYFRQENQAYMSYWDQMGKGHALSTNHQTQEWGTLQDQWDRFEVTNQGMKPVSTYIFQGNNPYLQREPPSLTTRHHALHSPRLARTLSENVLELEAAAQHSPRDATIWYELGVKQQENERESKAVEALQRAVDLDPDYLPSYLALAISHTNDNNRTATYNCISEWMHRKPAYKETVTQYRAQNPKNEGATSVEMFNDLIGCLISIVRNDTSGELDADLQIALAVLLNTNEEYMKAQDCFKAALSARPEDWLLYNRVGATLANSGNPTAALEYYSRALELNPGYIRARFNLGISCISLRQYDEAAQHILDALVLQESDHAPDPAGLNEKRGVTSAALWDSLKTACLHMQRIDLATLCDQQNIEGFRTAFYTSA